MRKIFENIIFIIAICVFVFSGYKIFSYWKENQISSSINKEVIDKAVEIIEEEKTEDRFSVDFEALWEENEDIVAWIYCPDTPINYPVLQANDNDYYLRRLLNGEYNIAGTIFMDYRNSSDFSDYNTMIYGHNMKNNTMFGSIHKYQNQSYYDEHKIIYVITPNQKYELKLFSGYLTDANSDIYEVPMDETQQKDYIKESIKLSTFKSDVEIFPEDKVVTLSTCSFRFENARCILMGVLRPI